MTNVKFSELGLVESAKKIKNKKICEFNLILKSDNSFDFNQQISGNRISNFIKKNWALKLIAKEELHIRIHAL